MSSLVVLEPGALALVEDLGRPGHADIGVSSSGALDRGALRLANRLVGNAESAAGLEILFGGLALRAVESAWIAVTGAWGRVTIESLDGVVEVEPNRATLVGSESVLRFEHAERGLRFYLAIRGGIEVPEVLGSKSFDQLSALGPLPLSSNDAVVVGARAAERIPAVDFVPVAPPPSGLVTVRAHPGPRADWFTAAASARFFEAEWVASADSNRVGIRLEPSGRAESSTLDRARGGELPSEAMIAGSVQVPPSGFPTVLLADHPVTGGYPTIAVVTHASLDAFAQLRPGQRVTFARAT